MKDSKHLLTKHYALSVLIQILVVLLIAVPVLQPYRERVAALTHIPATALWIPLLGALVICNIYLFRRLERSLVSPLRHLVSQTKLGAASFAFKKKSMNAEEDHLKHFIESQALKYSEMEQEIVRMENEILRAEAISRVTPEELDALRAQLERAGNEKKALLKQIADQETAKTAIDREHDRMRQELKGKNRELETLQHKLSEQVELTGEPSELTSLLVEKLRDPLNLISNLSWRLSKSWEETAPSKIREGLDQISRHSEEQLELLKKYAPGSKDAEEERA